MSPPVAYDLAVAEPPVAPGTTLEGGPSPDVAPHPTTRAPCDRADADAPTLDEHVARRPPALGRTAGWSAPGPSAAFFDLDRTLIAGSSAFILGRTARAAGLVPTRQFARDAGAAWRSSCAARATDTTDAVRDRILGAVRACARTTSIALNAEVLPKLLARSGPRPAGCSTSTATPGAARTSCRRRRSRSSSRSPTSLGMTAGIGTRGEVVDGVYNGDLDGPFCYGDGKVDGDGGDRPLGRARPRAVLRLLRLGQRPADAAGGRPPRRRQPRRQAGPPRPRHGWPIVHFSQRTKSVIRRSIAAAATTGIAVGSFAAGTVYAKRR